ncbi:MAG: hypothetical protein RLZZ77_1914 [Bacteroidota bacterium]|jgi:effector-binding domain-containing protein
MKKLLLLTLVITTLGACKKEDTALEETRFTLSVKNQYDGSPIVLNEMSLQNGVGEAYSVSLLKYYLAHAKLVKEDGTEVAFQAYKLIDESLPSSNKLVKTIPSGKYTKLKFSVGVADADNHSGAQAGDLDPLYGMFWTWNTGYIFFKHEGQFVHTDGSTQGLVYHYGGDHALIDIEIPISLEVSGENMSKSLVFDLHKAYTAETIITFSNNNNHQSLSASDAAWLSDMSGNLSQSFQFQ